MSTLVQLDPGLGVTRSRASGMAVAVRRACAVAALLACGTSAHAGIFDDDEARRAIIDLRTRISQLEDGAKSQNSQMAQQLQQMQNALLDLTNQNEQLRQQIAQLRGTNEQLAKDLSDVQRQQKNIAQGVDDRLKRVEPQQVSLDGKTFSADPEEIAAYEAATATLRSGDFDKAQGALGSFLRRWPRSTAIATSRAPSPPSRRSSPPRPRTRARPRPNWRSPTARSSCATSAAPRPRSPS
jgi:TolA-binding protein